MTSQTTGGTTTAYTRRPKAGDRFVAMGCEIEVRRVAKDGTWADIFVYQLQSRTSWTKRQRLPFPADWRAV